MTSEERKAGRRERRDALRRAKKLLRFVDRETNVFPILKEPERKIIATRIDKETIKFCYEVLYHDELPDINVWLKYDVGQWHLVNNILELNPAVKNLSGVENAIKTFVNVDTSQKNLAYLRDKYGAKEQPPRTHI